MSKTKTDNQNQDYDIQTARFEALVEEFKKLQQKYDKLEYSYMAEVQALRYNVDWRNRLRKDVDWEKARNKALKKENKALRERIEVLENGREATSFEEELKIGLEHIMTAAEMVKPLLQCLNRHEEIKRAWEWLGIGEQALRRVESILTAPSTGVSFKPKQDSFLEETKEPRQLPIYDIYDEILKAIESSHDNAKRSCEIMGGNEAFVSPLRNVIGNLKYLPAKMYKLKREIECYLADNEALKKRVTDLENLPHFDYSQVPPYSQTPPTPVKNAYAPRP